MISLEDIRYHHALLQDALLIMQSGDGDKDAAIWEIATQREWFNRNDAIGELLKIIEELDPPIELGDWGKQFLKALSESGMDSDQLAKLGKTNAIVVDDVMDWMKQKGLVRYSYPAWEITEKGRKQLEKETK